MAKESAAVPDYVDIGAFTYTVEVSKQRTADSETLGFTDEEEQVIVVGDYSRSLQRSILLHELLHAIFDVVGADRNSNLFEDEESEERVVSALTPWLYTVLRQNPHLVAYLLEDA